MMEKSSRSWEYKKPGLFAMNMVEFENATRHVGGYAIRVWNVKETAVTVEICTICRW